MHLFTNQFCTFNQPTVISFSLRLSALFLKRQIFSPAQNLSNVKVFSDVATFLKFIYVMLTLKYILIEMPYLKLSITPLGMDPPPPCSSLSFLHQCSISARDTLPFLSSSNTSNRVLMAVTNLGGRPSRARDCEDLSFILPCPVIIQTPDQEH